MPHVAPLRKVEVSHEAHGVLNEVEEKYGKVLNIYGTMAHAPDVLQGVALINEGLQDLSGTLRELAYYKASQVNECDYCSHYHKMAAKKAGISDMQLADLDNYAESDLFSEAEKAVLAYAEQLTQSAHVDPATVEAVKEHVSERELVLLAATVALANFTNRFNHGLDIELP